MSRVQHSKPSRRLGWAAAALVLLALPTAAQAQGFFFLFGSPSPYEIERRLEAAGYVLTGPLTLRGDVYLADVVARGEGPERLVIDAQSGRIVERYRGRADRWREAAAPPPSAWGERPAPVERAASARGDRPRRGAAGRLRAAAAQRPRDAQGRTRSRRPPRPSRSGRPSRRRSPSEQPAARRRRSAAGRRPPPRCFLVARGRPGFAEPGAERRCGAGSPAPAAAPPPIEAAKADAPSSPSRSAARRPAKSKAVNDIPVTPLD